MPIASQDHTPLIRHLSSVWFSSPTFTAGKWPSADATATASISEEISKSQAMTSEEIEGFKGQLSKLDKGEISKMQDKKSSTLRMKYREPKVVPPVIRVVGVWDTVGALVSSGRRDPEELIQSEADLSPPPSFISRFSGSPRPFRRSRR